MWTDIKRIDDQAENVAKFVFSKDNAVAEAVLYRYPTYRERTVICISTQSGCPVGCRFCGAGDYFVRSLTADEIVNQAAHALGEAWQAEGVLPADMNRLQIMFMSMGEPLLNMKAMTTAIRALHEAYPKAALLISTSAPDVDYEAVRNISVEVPTVGLQFSIHESTDEARDLLIPFQRKLCLRDIAAAGYLWHLATGRRPFFNYCAHDGNSSPADADRIRALFDPSIWEATISVVCERSDGLPATNQHQRDLATDFAGLLVERGYNTRVFDPAGMALPAAWPCRCAGVSVFTPDEVVSLNEFQSADWMHPFTCPHRDENHKTLFGDHGALVATTRGWICPFCDYTQDWAHDFMKNGAWRISMEHNRKLLGGAP